MSSTAPETRTRVVLLGASNLTLAWPRIMDQLQARFSAPLDIYTANGMGRSYVCDRSGFVFRQLPGILVSSLWDALPTPERDSSPVGLLTDFGNDLLYGREPLEIAAAAEECIHRLRSWDQNCQLVITRPPAASVESLSWLRFVLARFALFPMSRLTLDGVKSKTLELDQRLQEVAAKLDVPIHQSQTDWYGVDPIHVRRKHQSQAFGEMMDLWPTQADTPSYADNRSRPTAVVRWVWGREREAAQPSIASASTSVFAY